MAVGPSAPTGLIFENLHHQRFTVRWYAPANSGNVDFTYQLGYKLATSSDYKWEEEVPSSTTSLTIDWLLSDTEYDVVVKTLTALDGVSGAQSDVAKVTTLELVMDKNFPKTAMIIAFCFGVLVLVTFIVFMQAKPTEAPAEKQDFDRIDEPEQKKATAEMKDFEAQTERDPNEE